MLSICEGRKWGRRRRKKDGRGKEVGKEKKHEGWQRKVGEGQRIGWRGNYGKGEGRKMEGE
jgi:hypothetical protein